MATELDKQITGVFEADFKTFWESQVMADNTYKILTGDHPELLNLLRQYCRTAFAYGRVSRDATVTISALMKKITALRG